MSEKSENGVTIPEKSVIELLVTSLMPTSKYIETRFDHLQVQIDSIKEDIRDIKEDIRNLEARMDKRFEQVDKHFEQVDKRFEQIDRRFESMESRFNERFMSIENKLDILIARIDDKIEKGLRESRSLSIRLFTFAMTFSAISVIGMLGKIFGLF